MPVHRSTTSRSRLPDGTVVATTVREGTRRRRGEVNRYLLSNDKAYSTTTTRARYPDGTVVTSTRDTNAGAKVVFVLLLLVAGVVFAKCSGP